MTDKKDEALAEQPDGTWGVHQQQALNRALAEQQSGIKQVIEIYDSPEQPAYQAVKTVHDGKPVYVAEQPAQEQKPVPDWISYNKYTDELTISGRRYSAALFDERGFGSPPGTLLRIVDGPSDVVTLELVTEQPAQQQLTDLQKDAANLLFALQDAWPYVHQWCTIESKKRNIVHLMRKHGDFADLYAEQQQEPVAYDKTEINCFAQDLYDQKMREGKRGHYESMFHVIHQCIKKVSPPASKPPTASRSKT